MTSFDPFTRLGLSCYFGPSTSSKTSSMQFDHRSSSNLATDSVYSDQFPVLPRSFFIKTCIIQTHFVNAVFSRQESPTDIIQTILQS